MSKRKPDRETPTDKFIPELFIVPGILVRDNELQSLDLLVYATVYWFERMRDGSCFASNKAISDIVTSSSGGVQNSLRRLKQRGYISVVLDDEGHRKQIITLVRMGVSSVDDGGVSSVDDQNIKNKKEYKSETLAEIEKVYRAWLIYWTLGPDRDPNATPDEREQLIASAAKTYRLTDKRKAAIEVRLRDAGAPMIIKAIKNLGNAGGFYRGENDRNWSADLVIYLLRSYEKVEEWANKE